MEQNSDDDLLNTDDLVIDKPIIKEKSPEELRANTIDENLNDLAKALLMLSDHTNELRCLVAIKMLPNLLVYDKHNCIEKFFPKFKVVHSKQLSKFQILNKNEFILKTICFDYYHSIEFYDQISDSFEHLLTSCILSPREFSIIFLDSIRNKIFDGNESDATSMIWVNILLRIIPHLHNNIVKTSIFETYLNLSKKYNFCQYKRKYMCIILGRCSLKLDVSQIHDDLIPYLIDHCNDTRYEVRAAACSQLPTLGHLLNIESFTQQVLPELTKLECDESILVKLSCFQASVDLVTLISDDKIKLILIAKIQFLIDFGIKLKDELFIATISKNLGKIIQSIYTNDDLKMYFINIFQTLCKDNYCMVKRPISDMRTLWKTCKINLIQSLADVIAHLNDKELFKTKIYKIISDLVHDHDEQVREALINQMIHIAKAVGSPTHQLLIKDFCEFFLDESYEVKALAAQSLKNFLNLFLKRTSNGILHENLFVYSDDILVKLLKFEDNLSKTYKYTIHENILLSFELLPWLICTDELVDKVLPVLDTRLNSRALPIRLASVQLILKILRKIPRLQVRNQYLIKLLEFSRQTSCYKRIMFIDICKLVYDLYSREFFKEWFYDGLVSFSLDKVTNIKIALINALFGMKRLLHTVQEKEKINLLERHVEDLLRDEDKDVRDLAEKLVLQYNFFDEIKIRPNQAAVNDAFKEKNQIKEREEKELKEIESKKIKNTSKQQGHLTYFNNNNLTKEQSPVEAPRAKAKNTKLTITSRPLNSNILSQSAKVTLKERRSATNNAATTALDENCKESGNRRNSLTNDRTATKELKIKK